MKTTTKFLALTVVALLLSVTACKKETKTAASRPATSEELGQMNRDFAKALVAKDATAAANLYTENASLLPPNEPMVTGRENIKNYWQGAIDAGLVAASVKTIDASSDGDLGYEVGTFELKFQAEDGSIITDIGKYTEILKRNEQGEWISIYGMWSANE
ncbi:YybH family protein [Yeosuana sp.]|uniref:YybH family protein n=1 Tax=Yeosuana sp. TaxID=2529388 RepID=UPI004054F6D2